MDIASFKERILCETKQIASLLVTVNDRNLTQGSPNPSLNIDIESPCCLARVTIWKTLDCAFDVIDKDQSTTIFLYTATIDTFEELDDVVRLFLHHLQ